MRSLILLLLLISCQSQNSDEASQAVTKAAVINGEKVSSVEDQDLFYSAAMLLSPNGSLCSGVLISPNVVLTAAHCVDTEKGYPYYVSLGTTGIVNHTPYDENRYPVKKIIAYENYKRTVRTHDIALIILHVNAKEPFRPIKIHDESDFLQPGDPIFAAGFSLNSKPFKKDIFDYYDSTIDVEYEKTNYYEDVVSNFQTLKKISMLSRNTTFIQKGTNNERDAYLVAQPTGGICHGDSGGPAMVKLGEELFLVGINRSSLPRNGIKDCEYFAYMTSVIFYKDWITKNISENEGEQPVFAGSTHSINQNELSCSQFIGQTTVLFENLYAASPQLCKAINDKDLTYILDINDLKCQEACSDVRGFKGACEFFRKGTEKMVEHTEKACSNLTVE